MKKIKILFADLDGTLIDTVTGKIFPKGIWDMKFKFDVLNKIKELSPDHICIVTNQGGIGKFITAEDFKIKFEYVVKCIETYCNIKTLGISCTSEDKNNINRKPNPGMFYSCMKRLHSNSQYFKMDKESCLMLGDASGKPGDFSDSDRKAAENFGIDYIDVDDFVNFVNSDI